METSIAVPNTETVDGKALGHLERARAMVINSVEDFSAADDFCVALKELEKEIVGTFKDAKDKAFGAHRAICAAEAKHLDPVVQARKLVKPKMDDFRQEQERIRLEEERRQQEAAQKAAEDEALRQAAEAEKAGDKEGAEAIISAPVAVAPVVVAKTLPKSKTVIRRPWTYRADKAVKDLTDAELIAARAYLTWDTPKLSGQATSTQDSVKVPGITFYQRPC